jgi:hypothetical protein
LSFAESDRCDGIFSRVIAASSAPRVGDMSEPAPEYFAPYLRRCFSGAAYAEVAAQTVLGAQWGGNVVIPDRDRDSSQLFVRHIVNHECRRIVRFFDAPEI